MINIGLTCNVKKRKQLFQPFMDYVNSNQQTYNATVQFLDFDDDENAANAPVVDILFLKVTDDMNVAHVDELAKARLDRLNRYIATHSDKMLVVEKMEAVERVLDRVILYTFLHQQFQSLQTDIVHVPGITVLNSEASSEDLIREQFARDNVQFPVVCKTVVACGDIRTHNMALVFNERQLLQVIQSTEQEIPLPIVAQQFVNHGAVLHKAYVIGENIVVQQRPSLRNLSLDEPQIIRFNSQYKLPEELIANEVDASKAEPIDSAIFHQITQVLSQALELQLFGFDIVQDNVTGKFYIVDANYLPSYTSLPNVMQLLIEHLLGRYNNNQSSRTD